MIPIANPVMGEREHEAVADVLDTGHLASGAEVEAFEEEFAARCDASHAVATSNGTTALHAAFEALDLDDDATVVTSPFSFIASANAARLAGFDVRFGDVDPETYNLDPDSVERLLDERDVDAVLPVHLYGLPAEMPRFRELADEYGAALIEDAAQAHGAEIDGKPVGHFGDAACFSFYPTKNMTTGEGGMVVTDDAEIAAGVRSFINHGRSSDPDAGGYEHRSVGHNFRMTNLAAAIGRAQLERLPEYTAARRENAAALTEALDGSGVETPTEPEGYKHVYHQYTIRTDDREGLRAYLDEHGVGTGVYYPTCIHQQPPYAGVSATAPAAETAADEVLSLPVHPTVDGDDIETIAELVTAFATDERGVVTRD